MYLHLGQNTVVKTKDIVGIFDLDTSTVSKKTRDYLKKAEDNGDVINVTFDLPKTFIVTSRERKKQTVYISQLSSQTLEKRNKEGFQTVIK